jgi:Fe-S-cluster-containing dehydrogenase component
MLCARHTKERLDPACVKHCMAAVIKYGRIEDLAKEMDKPRVLCAPRP